MKKQSLLYLMMLILTQCNNDNTIVDPTLSENTTIKSGASFGMCTGYCRREIEINAGSVSFTKSGWITDEYPPIVTTSEITSQEWNSLFQLIDPGILTTMDDIYGCPDCVDQGSEWIEIIQPDFSKKITFEFGDSIEKIKDLLNRVREIRAEYENEI